jgi:hypothetical protein
MEFIQSNITDSVLRFARLSFPKKSLAKREHDAGNAAFPALRLPEEEVAKLWRVIEAYPMPFDAAYLQYKLAWSKKFAEQAISEYKKFVLLTKISPTPVTPSNAVDEVWHYHILHTKAYADFGTRIGGFLHHEPGTAREQRHFNRQYEQTLEFYERHFGTAASGNVWPR